MPLPVRPLPSPRPPGRPSPPRGEPGRPSLDKTFEELLQGPIGPRPPKDELVLRGPPVPTLSNQPASAGEAPLSEEAVDLGFESWQEIQATGATVVSVLSQMARKMDKERERGNCVRCVEGKVLKQTSARSTKTQTHRTRTK